MKKAIIIYKQFRIIYVGYYITLICEHANIIKFYRFSTVFLVCPFVFSFFTKQTKLVRIECHVIPTMTIIAIKWKHEALLPIMVKWVHAK